MTKFIYDFIIGMINAFMAKTKTFPDEFITMRNELIPNAKQK